MKRKLSEDKIQCASVATVLFWQSIDWDKIEKSVKSLQLRIVEAIKQKRFHKVKALQWIITNSFHAKLLAVKRVTTNKGGKTPGVDGVKWTTYVQKMKAAHNLNTAGYKATPLKRKYIMKKNGKLRPLGIPTMHDRAMQALFKLALEPIAETWADPNSYGFRKFRGCADAIEQAFNCLRFAHSAKWILEADIKACFDNISHQWILDNIPVNKNILKQWLKAGYIEKNQCFPIDNGTPQGGVISPVIANMVLDGIEKLLNDFFEITFKNGYKAKNPYKINFIRYADDFIITANSLEVLKNEVWPKLAQFLKERGLELSPEKTRITHINDGFDFLGVTIKKYGKKVLTKPSKKSIKAVYLKIRKVINGMKTAEQFKLIDKLNPIITGWTNYHKPYVAKRIFSSLDNLLFKLLWRWAKRRHPNKSLKWIKKKYFKSMGRRNWVFAAKIGNMDYELTRFDKTKIVRHIKIKSAANPFDADWQEYFRKRKAYKSEESIMFANYDFSYL